MLDTFQTGMTSTSTSIRWQKWFIENYSKCNWSDTLPSTLPLIQSSYTSKHPSLSRIHTTYTFSASLCDVIRKTKQVFFLNWACRITFNTTASTSDRLLIRVILFWAYAELILNQYNTVNADHKKQLHLHIN